MFKKKILFVSTNIIWGGSEILWTESAKLISKKGFDIKAAIFYEFGLIKEFLPSHENYFNLGNRIENLSLPKRILNKTKLFNYNARDRFCDELQQYNPNLVIISQGNNIEGRSFMKECIRYNIPFATITHLVTPHFLPSFNDELIDELNALYEKAKSNFFISKNSLSLHEKFLGKPCLNSSIIYNPFVKKKSADLCFPKIKDGVYRLALVGRIEMFHKGYDLLIEVLKQTKWKERPIHFSLFGKGPHIRLLQRLINEYDIRNFTIHDHEDEVQKIWQTHHILIMPSRMEGQSLSLIEAMRFSRAAIVTDVGGTNELIEDGVNGFIAKYPIPYFIDEALERAWQSRSEWEQLGINAAKAIEEKHPEDAIVFFNEKIEEVLERNMMNEGA